MISWLFETIVLFCLAATAVAVSGSVVKGLADENYGEGTFQGWVDRNFSKVGKLITYAMSSFNSVLMRVISMIFQEQEDE